MKLIDHINRSDDKIKMKDYFKFFNGKNNIFIARIFIKKADIIEMILEEKLQITLVILSCLFNLKIL